ncbi:hypothetical protein ACJJTC_015525 [Scirpophaga incertulas]
MANFATDGQICIERSLRISVFDYIEDISSDFDIPETCLWIKNNKFTKVCLQFPDDLLSISTNIYEEIKKRVDVDLYILGDTSYASCCVDSTAAMHVQANAVVHYGHTCFTKTNIPVYIVLPKKKIDVGKIVETIHKNLKMDNNTNQRCLFYGAEFEHGREALIKMWFQYYPKCYVGVIENEDTKDKVLGRLVKDVSGNVLPVDVLQDCICVYVGLRGQTLFNFTTSVAAKAWFLVDTLTHTLTHSAETTWFKRRHFLVEKCKDANVVGILVCQLSGNQTKDIITRMKQLCQINGKKSYIVSVGKPNVSKLANFPEIDIYVMIACPENDLYDNRDFYKPIVYPYELDVALNCNRQQYFTTHIPDYDQILPGRRYYCDIDHIKEVTDVSLITGKIRETCIPNDRDSGLDVEVKHNWALENIGQTLKARTWQGLEQKFGETEALKAVEGRKGIPLQYSNEPQ